MKITASSEPLSPEEEAILEARWAHQEQDRNIRLLAVIEKFAENCEDMNYFVNKSEIFEQAMVSLEKLEGFARYLFQATILDCFIRTIPTLVSRHGVIREENPEEWSTIKVVVSNESLCQLVEIVEEVSRRANETEHFLKMRLLFRDYPEQLNFEYPHNINLGAMLSVLPHGLEGIPKRVMDSMGWDKYTLFRDQFIRGESFRQDFGDLTFDLHKHLVNVMFFAE